MAHLGVDPAISGAQADPESDSFKNLAEYALTLDPRAPSLGTAVVPPWCRA
jgi:hypothetical protein